MPAAGLCVIVRLPVAVQLSSGNCLIGQVGDHARAVARAVGTDQYILIVGAVGDGRFSSSTRVSVTSHVVLLPASSVTVMDTTCW